MEVYKCFTQKHYVFLIKKIVFYKYFIFNCKLNNKYTMFNKILFLFISFYITQLFAIYSYPSYHKCPTIHKQFVCESNITNEIINNINKNFINEYSIEVYNEKYSLKIIQYEFKKINIVCVAVNGYVMCSTDTKLTYFVKYTNTCDINNDGDNNNDNNYGIRINNNNMLNTLPEIILDQILETNRCATEYVKILLDSMYEITKIL